MLTWLDARNGTTFSALDWTSGTLSFSLAPGAGANGLQLMLPAQTAPGALAAVTRNGVAVPFTLQTIKGMAYATFQASAGNYVATYGPPDTTITASPANPTTSTSASFSFTASPSAGATFQCSLDGAAFAACTSPRALSGLAYGSHTFQVRAVNAAGADATPASFGWTINPPVPDTTITSAPGSSTTSTSASFSFTANPSAGATFECQLDGAGFAPCVSPQAYTGLALGGHTFQVRAVNTSGADPSPATVNWTITTVPPPDTTITASPANPTTSTSASFSFTASPSAGATFECALDGAAFAACTSPRAYSSLAVAGHTFQVRAVSSAGTDPTPASFTWTINAVTEVNLVAAYAFEEASGTTTADASGNGHTGTLANATRTASGRFGSALSFNGTNATVNVNDSALLDLSNAMTFSAWVNPSALGTGVWRTVLMKERPGGLAYGLYANDSATRPSAYVQIGSTEAGRNGPASLPLNTWTHLAVTYNGSTLRLYVNGTQVATRNITGSVSATTGMLRIGGNSIWGEYFAGLIDEVRIYSRVLSAAEITTIMNTPITP
jgi:hypothetical protein